MPLTEANLAQVRAAVARAKAAAPKPADKDAYVRFARQVYVTSWTGSWSAAATTETAMAVIFAGRIFTRENQRRFGVFGDWRPNGPLFFKLVRLGAPGGAQIFLDVFAAAFFIALTGRIGKAELTATSLVFAANSPAFVPLLGLSSGLAVVVGQAMLAVVGTLLPVLLLYNAYQYRVFRGKVTPGGASDPS